MLLRARLMMSVDIHYFFSHYDIKYTHSHYFLVIFLYIGDQQTTDNSETQNLNQKSGQSY